KAVLATQQQDYMLATRYFQDARKIAPDAPDIYYNLGLAEAKIPGRELRAISWFGAYLAANPKSTSTAAIKDQIAALDVKSQSNLSHLIQSAQDAASQIADDNSKAYNWGRVAGLWAESGDMTAAMKTADLIQDAGRKSQAQASIAEGQMSAGNFEGALETAGQI